MVYIQISINPYVHFTGDLLKQQESRTKHVGKKNLRITTIQDGEEQRLRGAEKGRQQEAARELERMRLNLFETGKEMTKLSQKS